MDDPAPQPDHNPPISFKPREFALGLAVAAAIVLAIGGARYFMRAETARATSPPNAITHTNASPR